MQIGPDTASNPNERPILLLLLVYAITLPVAIWAIWATSENVPPEYSLLAKIGMGAPVLLMYVWATITVARVSIRQKREARAAAQRNGDEPEEPSEEKSPSPTQPDYPGVRDIH